MASQYESDTNSGQPHRPESNHATPAISSINLFEQTSAPPIKLGPMLDPPDYLAKAVKSADSAPAQNPSKPLTKPDETHDSSTDIGDPGDSLSARNKLAEEALLAQPGQIRQFFPALMKDLGQKPDDDLSMSEIDLALKNPHLSQVDVNLLTVFKAGYTEFSQVVDFDSELQADTSGISGKSLTVLDKAMNRNITDDPILTKEKEFGWVSPVIGVSTTAAAGARYFKATADYASYIGLGSAVLTGLGYEIYAAEGGMKDDNDRKYDAEKSAYTAFVTGFEKGHQSK